MKEIIKIEKQLVGTEEVNTVNSRELHGELGVKKDFSDWMSHQVNSLGLELNIDYITQTDSSTGGRPQKNYILTLDTAKHIAMASRTAKGKEVRKYFIAIEKQFRAEQSSSSDLSQIMPVLMTMVEMMKQMMEMQMQTMQMMQQQKIEHKKESLAPEQLDKIKLAVNRAAKPLADCHNFTWGRAVKEVYSELNGRMGVFAYYHIAPHDFEEAMKLLKSFREQKEKEIILKSIQRVNESEECERFYVMPKF